MSSQHFNKVCWKIISRATALSFSLLFLLNGYADSAAAQSRRFQQDNSRLVFPSKNNVRVDNSTGNIEIEANQRNSIEVIAKPRGSSQSIQLDELSVVQSIGQIWITAKPSNSNKEIDIKLMVPEGAILKLFSQTGDIKITGAAGGGLAKTDGGNIILNLPDRINADIVLSSNSGTVQTTRSLNSSTASNRHFLHGQLGEGGAILAAYSEFGQVVLANPGEETKIVQTSEPENKQPQRDLSTIQKIKSALPTLRRSDDKPEPTSGSATADSSNSANDEMADNVLKIESQLVSVNASVSNGRGQPIANLRKEDFNIFEDGVQQEIVHFQPVNTPFNMVLLIDLSGSVRDKINLIRKAARRFVQAARSDDKLAVVTFSSSTRIVCPLTNNREELYRRIEDIRQPEGGTNFYDAVEDTLGRVLNNVRGERNVIVVMSDGVDNALPGVPGRGSDISYNELLAKVQESDALIFPIYLDTEAESVDDFGAEVGRSYQAARTQLKELADATGGVMFYANRVEDLEGRYEQVAAELRTIYSLGYYPSNNSSDSNYHKIRVRVSAADARVRARRGYYQK